MLDLQFWDDVFTGMGRLDTVSALHLGWQSLCSFSFGNSDTHQLLRRNILLYLLRLLETLPDFYEPPYLCSGYLNLLTGDYPTAERHLRLLLKKRAHIGILHLFLAEALWRQNKKESAGPSYARALLLDPGETCRQHISSPALVRLLEERKPALAPIRGYITGLLPLVNIEGMMGSTEIRIYEALCRAELSRSKGDHRRMIEARRDLKDLAPEIFQEYLEKIGKEDLTASV